MNKQKKRENGLDIKHFFLQTNEGGMRQLKTLQEEETAAKQIISEKNRAQVGPVWKNEKMSQRNKQNSKELNEVFVKNGQAYRKDDMQGTREVNQRNDKANCKNANAVCKIIPIKSNKLPSDFFKHQQSHFERRFKQFKDKKENLGLDIEPFYPSRQIECSLRDEAMKTPCFGEGSVLNLQIGVDCQLNEDPRIREYEQRQQQLDKNNLEKTLSLTLMPIILKSSLPEQKNVNNPKSQNLQNCESAIKCGLPLDKKTLHHHGGNSNRVLKTQSRRLETLPVSEDKLFSERNNIHRPRRKNRKTIQGNAVSPSLEDQRREATRKEIHKKDWGKEMEINSRFKTIITEKELREQHSHRETKNRARSREVETSVGDRQHRLKHKQLQRRNHIYKQLENSCINKKLFPSQTVDTDNSIKLHFNTVQSQQSTKVLHGSKEKVGNNSKGGKLPPIF